MTRCKRLSLYQHQGHKWVHSNSTEKDLWKIVYPARSLIYSTTASNSLQVGFELQTPVIIRKQLLCRCDRQTSCIFPFWEGLCRVINLISCQLQISIFHIIEKINEERLTVQLIYWVHSIIKQVSFPIESLVFNPIVSLQSQRVIKTSNTNTGIILIVSWMKLRLSVWF